jgi:hypothetical protein
VRFVFIVFNEFLSRNVLNLSLRFAARVQILSDGIFSNV